MEIFSEESANRIRSTLANLTTGPDIALPISEDFTVHIESNPTEPVNRAWKLRVQVTTNIVSDTVEESPYDYIHEVNERGQQFITEWNEVIEGLTGIEDHSWNFLFSKAYSCGSDVMMATYTENLTVHAEDLLENIKSDQKVVRISYSVPREVYVVVDEAVDVDDVSELSTHIQNVGWDALPLVDLTPEMVKPRLSPGSGPNIPTVGIEEVESITTEVLRPNDDS